MSSAMHGAAELAVCDLADGAVGLSARIARLVRVMLEMEVDNVGEGKVVLERDVDKGVSRLDFVALLQSHDVLVDGEPQLSERPFIWRRGTHRWTHVKRRTHPQSVSEYRTPARQ